MAGDQDQVEAYLRVVRVQMDALASTLDQALGIVPPELRDQVRSQWQQEADQPIRRTRILTGTGGPRPWFADWRPSDGYHWRRLRSYLLDRVGRTEVEVNALDDQSNKVLSNLEDPRSVGPASFRVQGLVLGYIQSGKTANISALIAKAADLGYKFVIVLSGIEDALRKQTQDRLGRELGLLEDPAGVGLPVFGERWVGVTTGELKGDFNPGTFDSSVLQGNERVIAVVKKNVFVLSRLVEWVEGAPADLPVLIIDDEADLASVNTGGNRPPDGGGLDPSRINSLIRDLIARFRRVAYVAYTATPFANVFIDPGAIDREVLEDLYPKDFIIALPKPPRYVGAELLFGRDALGEEETGVQGLGVIRLIPPQDIASLVPPPRGAGTFSPQMCLSLESAFQDFVLGSAAKLERIGDSVCSMLIHTSQLTRIHNSLGGIVLEYMTRLRQAWLYDKASIRPVLEERWNNDFRPVTASLDASLDRSFEQIEPFIDTFFRWSPDVRVLNMTSADVLDYQANPEMKVVLIGGNRLSRGLTLEGLVVSYYVRNAANYDTLLQMGRWFGYRERYVDLTRLWTTGGLEGRFRHLALVEEELRDQIAVYERARITPLQFGPRIRTHPAMAITAANKLGSARPVQLSFEGQLRQTTRFRLGDVDWIRANLEATRRFLAQHGAPTDGDPGRPEWTTVPWRSIVGFLSEYRSYQDPDSFDADTLVAYIRTQAESNGELVRWHVAMRGLPTSSPRLGTEDLNIQGRPAVNTILRSRLRDDPDSIGVLTSPAQPQGPRRRGDEEVGLTDEQIDRAREAFARGDFNRLGTALRTERDRAEGLLLIYPVSRNSYADTKERTNLFDRPEEACTLIGLALVFPASDSSATVTYMAGAAGVAADDDAD